MTVGSTLKYHRKKANLSQIELAHKLHVSRQSISSWENNHSYPSLDNLILEIFCIKITKLSYLAY